MQNYEWRGRPVVFWRSARRHKIGRARVMAVIALAPPRFVLGNAAGDARIEWIGPDNRGVPLEIVALDERDRIVVIHAMPLAFRDRRGA